MATSITPSRTDIGLINIPMSAGIVCALSSGNKIIHKLIINKYNKYKKQYGRDQQTFKSFNKFYSQGLQDNIIDKNDNESLCKFFI